MTDVQHVQQQHVRRELLQVQQQKRVASSATAKESCFQCNNCITNNSRRELLSVQQQHYQQQQKRVASSATTALPTTAEESCFQCNNSITNNSRRELLPVQQQHYQQHVRRELLPVQQQQHQQHIRENATSTSTYAFEGDTTLNQNKTERRTRELR